jgi:hypothetical protein
MERKPLAIETMELLDVLYAHLAAWGLGTAEFDPAIAAHLSARISEVAMRIYDLEEQATREFVEE